MSKEQPEQVTTEKPFAVATISDAEPPKRQHITVVPPRALIAGTLIVLLVAFGAFLTWQLLPVVFLVLVAVLLATAIEPLVNKLRRGPFSRTQGILVVYTGIVIILVAVGWLTIPLFLTQIGQVVENLPRTMDSLQEMADESGSEFVSQQVQYLTIAVEQFTGQQGTPPVEPEQQLTSVTTTAVSAAAVVFESLAVFVIAFYWLTERTLIKRWFISLLPADRANRVRRVWDDIEVKVGGWVRGQLTLMGVVGVVSAIGYFVIGVSYWPALALFIAICEAIPLVGPYIGTAPAIIVALTQNGNDGLPALLGMGDIGPLPRALAVIIFAILLQTVEANVLIPRVMKNSVGISPLTVMVSILVGAALAGLAGALLAVPLAGAVQVIVQDLRAAARSQHELEVKTQAAEETRRRDDELVVARTDASGNTLTEVQGEA